jgi:MFS family permease
VARIPAIQDRLRASPGQFGLALLGMPVGLVPAAVAAGWLIARHGAKRVTGAATVCFCAALPLPALAPSVAALFVSLVVFGAALGTMDVGMNSAGAAVERLYGRPIMSSFHGVFSLGGIAGASMGGLIAAAGVGPAPHFAVVAVASGALALAVLPGMPRGGGGAGGDAPALVLPSRSLLLVGLVGFGVLLCEGAVADWSAIYLRDSLGAAAGVAPLGYAAFSLAMAAARFAGDRANHLLGPVVLVRLGGACAALGVLLSVLAGTPPVAILGFGLVGLGYAAVFPVVVSAAGKEGSMAPGPAIAAVTTLGYFGFLAGPPLIGFAAQLTSLRLGLGLLAVLGALIAALAGSVAPARST